MSPLRLLRRSRRMSLRIRLVLFAAARRRAAAGSPPRCRRAAPAGSAASGAGSNCRPRRRARPVAGSPGRLAALLAAAARRRPRRRCWRSNLARDRTATEPRRWPRPRRSRPVTSAARLILGGRNGPGRLLAAFVAMQHTLGDLVGEIHVGPERLAAVEADTRPRPGRPGAGRGGLQRGDPGDFGRRLPDLGHQRATARGDRRA